MPANMSELILILKGLPQKQYILNNDNKHEVQLTVENNRLTVLDVTGSPYKTINILMVVVLLLVASLIAIIVLRKQKLITQDIYLDTK